MATLSSTQHTNLVCLILREKRKLLEKKSTSSYCYFLRKKTLSALLLLINIPHPCLNYNFKINLIEIMHYLRKYKKSIHIKTILIAKVI